LANTGLIQFGLLVVGDYHNPLWEFLSISQYNGAIDSDWIVIGNTD
jgi:hypothetical protein